MGIVGMLIFIPLVSVLYTIFREFVYLRLKEKNIKQVTKTVVEEYTAEEIAAMEKNIKRIENKRKTKAENLIRFRGFPLLSALLYKRNEGEPLFEVFFMIVFFCFFSF